MNDAIKDQVDDAVSRLSAEMIAFGKQLAEESDRAALIIGAVRIDIALERVLKSVMLHHPGGKDDNLFDQERPLGTFSAKIDLAFRLGLIDGELEHAIHMVRKIRNDCAHSLDGDSLTTQKQKQRLHEAVGCAKKSPAWRQMHTTLSELKLPRERQDLFQVLLIVLMCLELKALVEKPRYQPMDITMKS